MKERIKGYSRRTFLKATAASTLVTTLSAYTTGCNLFSAEMDKVGKKMTDLLNHPVEARELGQEYIESIPGFEKLSPEQLTRRLLGVLNIDPENISKDVMNILHTSLRQQIRQDFVDESVVILNGFMLSNTEMMLCALATKNK